LIERLQFLRSVGRFDSVNAGAQLRLTKLTLVYAENARGKTTLAAILRSLRSGDPSLITERQRLGSPNAPHVVIGLDAPPPLVFQNGAWSARLSQLAIFDDQFVAENVCSGLAIETEHRQNLHELILGAQGVMLNAAVQTHVARVEEHNQALRAKAEVIPAAERGTLNVDAFCALEPVGNIEPALQDAERAIAAARSAEAVRQESDFLPFAVPAFDTAAVNTLLQRNLPDLDAEAVAKVQTHFAKLGGGAESWVAEGMPRIAGVSAGQERELCPFCAQDLAGSPLMGHYRAYFSEAYAGLKNAVADQITAIERTHGGDVPAAFERAVRVATQRREFWRAFMEVPEVRIDTAAVARSWNAARTAVLSCLRAKQAAPLDPAALPSAALAAIEAYDESRRLVSEVSASLQAVNRQIALVREQAAAANVWRRLRPILPGSRRCRPALIPRSLLNVRHISTRKRPRPRQKRCATKHVRPSNSIGATFFRRTKPRSTTT
jgi:wobble nucleotide-excising tRNase